MSLKAKIDTEIKEAMKAKAADRLRALRAIKSMILLAQTEGAGQHELTEEDELKLLSKAVKQRKDSAATYSDQGRQDLADIELGELEVIESFLPKQLTDDELKLEVQKIIAETGASSMKDMGKVMGMATKATAGKADGKKVADMVKTLLSGN